MTDQDADRVVIPIGPEMERALSPLFEQTKKYGGGIICQAKYGDEMTPPHLKCMVFTDEEFTHVKQTILFIKKARTVMP
jgi:hypothetical protein